METAFEQLSTQAKDEYKKVGRVNIAWLINKLSGILKEVEKQQIVDAWNDGRNGWSTETGEGYYNKTYNPETLLPIERAAEMISRFNPYPNDNIIGFESLAKKHALLSVDSIINEYESINTNEATQQQLLYWNDVKNYINLNF
jgi:hypothetical protein